MTRPLTPCLGKKTNKKHDNIVFGVCVGVCVHAAHVEEEEVRCKIYVRKRPGHPLKGVRNLIRI